MTDTLFDKHHFLQSLADDVELAHELLAAFMEDSPARCKSLEEALAAKDTACAAKLAHSLKGMCGVVRAPQLVDCAFGMETSAKSDDLEKTRQLFENFKKLLPAAHKEMQNFIDA